MTTNRALFDCDGDGGNAGFDAVAAHVINFTLRDTTGVSSWILMVWSTTVVVTGIPILDNPPQSSKGAPLLTLNGATSGQSVNASSPAATITNTALPTGTNSWIVRSVVNGGMSGNPAKPDPALVWERMIVVRSGAGKRKPVVTETIQYEPDSWAGVICDLIGP